MNTSDDARSEDECVIVDFIQNPKAKETSTETPYKCTDCGECFTAIDKLIKHVASCNPQTKKEPDCLDVCKYDYVCPCSNKEDPCPYYESEEDVRKHIVLFHKISNDLQKQLNLQILKQIVEYLCPLSDQQNPCLKYKSQDDVRQHIVSFHNISLDTQKIMNFQINKNVSK